MNATLLDVPVETREPWVSSANCPAVERLERALGQLRAGFRREVGYWKSQHARAVQRIKQLKEELDQSRGQIRALQDRLFGRKSEKSASSDRSNDLFDPEAVAAAAKKRGAQPGHAGHGRRDYSHLPVAEEFVTLPEESLVCPICGRSAAIMPDTEDSEVLEIDVQAHRRRIRHVYRRNRQQTSNSPCPGTSRPNGAWHWQSTPYLYRPPTHPSVGRRRMARSLQPAPTSGKIPPRQTATPTACAKVYACAAA